MLGLLARRGAGLGAGGTLGSHRGNALHARRVARGVPAEPPPCYLRILLFCAFWHNTTTNLMVVHMNLVVWVFVAGDLVYLLLREAVCLPKGT